MSTKIGIAVAITIALLTLPAIAQQKAQPASRPAASDISPAVAFSISGGTHLTVADLRGKVALVIFYQSWCPICNGWSPQMFQEVEQAAGDRRDVVLLAVKVDGGNWNDVGDYLKGRITTQSRWVLGIDPKATWYQVSTGVNELYGYIIVGPDGKVVSTGKAGMFYTNPRRFVLASTLTEALKNASTSTILPKARKYHASLDAAAQAAELRQFAVAGQLAKAAAGQGKEAAASAKEFQDDLAKWAADRVKDLSPKLADQTTAATDRLDVYLDLKQIADGFPATESGRAAKVAIKDLAKDKALSSEVKAREEYLVLVAKAGTLDTLIKNAQFAAALKALAQKYPSTRYGAMATTDATRVGG